MASFSSGAFSTSAFSILAFDFGSTPPPPVVVARGGDGWYIRRKKRPPDRRVEDETDERLKFESVISDIYDRLHGLTPEKVAEVEAILKVKIPVKKQVFFMPEMNIAKLMADASALQRLLNIRAAVMQAAQDEEAAIAFLMMSV